ncbi:MAG: LPS export ABC transporter periplasmic protein LptC [Minwuia sp.]|uniref:LPS export ABC transporter periplasmic protein LptC n=1 Tax=Minwuia sp. TaxID=2493630 RepID=UPI003A85C270
MSAGEDMGREGRRFSIAPRHERTQGATARRRHHVTLMKYGLFGASLALVAAIVIWPQVTERRNGQAIDFAEVARSTPKSTMTNARFVGGANQNLNVTATQVVQDSDQPSLVHLTNPEGDTTTDDGIWLHLQADRGQFDRETSMMTLNGGVSLHSDRGEEMHSSTATFNLVKGEVEGGDPVHGHGPLGRFSADRFALRDNGRVLFLRGNVRLVIEPGGVSR